MADIVIATWPVNRQRIFMVTIGCQDDQLIVDCRAWFPGSKGFLRPELMGLTVPITQFPPLAAAFDKALIVCNGLNRIGRSSPS
jgi:hypothetical protein